MELNLFNNLFEKFSINAVVIMTPDGKIISVNDAFTSWFGFTKDMIIGKMNTVIFTEEDRKAGLPESELERVLNTGQATDKNYLLHADGTVSWVSGESVYRSDEPPPVILKVIQDLQQSKNAENEISNLTLLNEKILASIEDVVIVLNKNLEIIKFNKAFLGLFRRDPFKSNTNFQQLIEPYDKEKNIISAVKNAFVRSKGFSKRELEIDALNGEKIYFDISCVPLAEEETHMLLVLHNITAHKLAERQREDIIAFVAHELRNPLANIILCNELLGEFIKQKNVDDSVELLASSKSSVMRLNKMVAELYDATKISGRNLTLEKSSFSFDDMVKEAILTVQVLYPSYKIEVNGKAGTEVYADKFRIIQVITNYLSNGIKYSFGHHVVKLFVEKKDDNIIVKVSDFGLGIDKDQLPKVFSRFFRAEKTKNLEGAGLGLYLCKQIIEAHHGSVWVESEEGHGSDFYFSIPLKS